MEELDKNVSFHIIFFHLHEYIFNNPYGNKLIKYIENFHKII